MIDWLAYTFIKSIGWVLCRLPPGVAVWCGERLGLLGYWLRPKRRLGKSTGSCSWPTHRSRTPRRSKDASYLSRHVAISAGAVRSAFHRFESSTRARRIRRNW